MERVLFHSRGAAFPPRAPDPFGLTRIALGEHNAEDALLASGSIPLVCDPVPSIAGAPRGDYWDGGLIDYHLLLPYHELKGLVLYPHFVPHITPGWLDKFLPWRKHTRAHPWLDNLVLIAPSAALLARMANGKLPDRSDFHRYGLDHAARMRDWKRAIAESERFADEVMAWLMRPDPTIIKPL
jgi:predicted acylesterase/phospholipase RssA